MLEHHDIDGGEFDLDLNEGARGLVNVDVEFPDGEITLNLTVEHLDSYQRVSVELSPSVCRDLGHDLLHIGELVAEEHEDREQRDQ